MGRQWGLAKAPQQRERMGEARMGGLLVAELGESGVAGLGARSAR